jgi:hypothetical protein
MSHELVNSFENVPQLWNMKNSREIRNEYSSSMESSVGRLRSKGAHVLKL